MVKQRDKIEQTERDQAETKQTNDGMVGGTCELLQKTPEEQKLILNQYDKLINARNFHYDNFNKWLMSFYVIIGALFVALYNLHDKSSYQLMELCVAIVGYVVSMACILSMKGYYFWETNWIMLIHHFEKKYLKPKNKRKNIVENRVYSIMANKKANSDINNLVGGANVSTSKVALFVTWIIAILWGALTISLLINLKECKCLENVWIQFGIGVISAIISFFVTRWVVKKAAEKLPSRIKELDDLEIPLD